MNPNDYASVEWRKSSHSQGNGNCVEVASTLPQAVAVRDSKNPAKGHIAIPTAAFAALLKTVK